MPRVDIPMCIAATYDRIMKEVPTFKFISQSILIERLKIGGSLARVAIKHLAKEGQIKKIVHHNGQLIYSEHNAHHTSQLHSLTNVVIARVTTSE